MRAANPAIALQLQSLRPVGRVAELGSLDVLQLRLAARGTERRPSSLTLANLRKAP